METLGLNNEIELNIENSKDLEEKQQNFLETNLGKVVNAGLEIGIRAVLPDSLEEDAIEIKNDLFENGIKDAWNTTIEKVIDLGKNVIGIFTGNIKNINQAKEIVEEGGLLENISDLIDNGLDKCKNTGILNKNIINIVKATKETILENVEKNVNDNFEKQIENIEKINNYIENWTKNYENKNLSGMKKQYKKIMELMEEILPIEETINKANEIENLQKLIENNGGNFEISNEEKELAKKII